MSGVKMNWEGLEYMSDELRRTKHITFLNEKGGVGKTSLATHTAAGLAIRGYSVVLVDADPQGHATVSMGLEKRPDLYQLLVYPDDNTFEDHITRINPKAYASNDTPSKGELYLIPTDASARVIPMMTSDTNIVAHKFEEIAGAVDYVIWDTAPTPSLLHGSIYMATDYIVYPTECAFLSFDGLVASIGRSRQVSANRKELGLSDIKIGGIIPNKVRRHGDGYVASHQHALDMLTERFGSKVWQPITMSSIWEKTQFAQRVLYRYAPTSESTTQAWSVVSNIEAIS